WGILIAVFGTRLILPILIVSVGVLMSPKAVAQLAVTDPTAYGYLRGGAKYAIYSFGVAFLFMVALKYFVNKAKTTHWLRLIEYSLSRWGRIEAIEIGIALTVLMGLSFFVAPAVQATVLTSGLVGVILFILMQGITSSFSI